MATETNQAAAIVCGYCGRSISHPRELLVHNEGRCAQQVNEIMLGAQTKHGTTLGQHHAELEQQKTKSSLRYWVSDWYHEIMLASMLLELLLLAYIACKR